MRAALLLVALALAGCAAAPPEGAGDAPSPTAPALSLRFEDCAAQEVSLAVRHEDAMERIPEGFVPVRAGSFSAPDPTERTAHLLLITQSCTLAAQPATALFAWLLVIPSEAYADPDADGHVVQLGAVTGRTDVDAALRSWNMSSALGEVTHTPASAVAASRSTVVVETESARIELETAAESSDAPDAAAEKFRAFVTRGREIVGAYDAFVEPHLHTRGAATVRIAGDHDLFPAPISSVGTGSNVRPFAGFELRFVPLDTLQNAAVSDSK